MTEDSTLNEYLYSLQQIINNLDSLKNEISSTIQGLGQEQCVRSLERVKNQLLNIKNEIVRRSYYDIHPQL